MKLMVSLKDLTVTGNLALQNYNVAFDLTKSVLYSQRIDRDLPED